MPITLKLHSKKRRVRCLNRIEQCFAANVGYTNLSAILNNIVEPQAGVTILFNIVDNCVGNKTQVSAANF
jgi:hypothetical protein